MNVCIFQQLNHNKKGVYKMIKIVYNMNKSLIDLLSRLNSKIEIKYNMVPLSFEEVAMNLNNRVK
jgi:hypothetical protein